MKGWKVYFDTEAWKFRCESEASEVQSRPGDSTTSWFYDLASAIKAVDQDNEKLNDVFICKDCGRSFWLTEEEREWFADRGMNAPKRCATCRNARKKSQNNEFNLRGKDEKEIVALFKELCDLPDYRENVRKYRGFLQEAAKCGYSYDKLCELMRENY